MAFENPFLQPSAVRKSALQYLWSDEPENAIQASPAPSSSFIADLFGVGESSPSTGQATPAAPAAPTSSEGGEAGGSSSNTGLTIGIGNATDTITQDAMIAALWGLITGGIPGAIKGGGKSYVQDTMAVLNEVNSTEDPIQALNALQGWTDTREPSPVVSGKTNYNTPYDSTNDSRVNPAPVVSGQTNYNTPYSGMLQVDPGIQAAIAQAEAQAAAQAQAAADEAAAAQAAQAQAQAEAQAQAAAQAAAANAAANAAAIAAAQSGDYSSNSGGDLGTGASDAAGFGGYGGVW
jgi:chemotaxis protein histidine kinase CheA